MASPSQPPMRKLVFISYAHEDRTKAEELAAEVEKAHIPCWIAPRDVPFGANYAEAILDAIDTADVVVILLSSHANSSIFVAKEIERAVTYRKHILPVRLENIEPARRLEFHLADVQWLDLWSGSSDQPENIRRLIETIRARLQERAVPGPAPGPLRSVDLPARKPIPEPKVIGMMQPPSTSSQR